VEGYAELLLGIATEVLLDQRRSEAVEAGATAVWVVNRLPARVTARATSKVCPLSAMKLRARSSTAKAA
jgi:pyridoxal biosynthesis lyase PdxS